MNLHDIKRPKIKKNHKRLGKGQGTGQGGTSGRGNKGQKARSGGNIPAYFEGGQMPIQRRLPKRGFTNIFKVEYRVVNLERLAELNETEVDVQIMELKGIVRKTGKAKPEPVKVLATGKEKFTKTMTIRAHAFSKAAREIIEQHGGKAEVI
jgi:large subunit ribosomal protein L15